MKINEKHVPCERNIVLLSYLYIEGNWHAPVCSWAWYCCIRWQCSDLMQKITIWIKNVILPS